MFLFANSRNVDRGLGRGAFTLVEMMVVLLIMAILSAGVCLSLAGPERQARVEDIVGQIQHYDAMARTQARQSNRPLRLVVNISRNRIDCLPFEGEPISQPLALPDHIRIKRILLQDRQVLSGTGEVALTCSTLGVTPSYGLTLEEAAGGRHVIFFLGLTGQMLRVDERFQSDEVFKQLAHPAGGNAH